ncbi:alpha/beta fold hydrolase, partial [Streptomyces sp. NPDC002851]
NLREPVRLDLTQQQLLTNGLNVFIEISPHPVLLMPLTDGALQQGHDQTVVVPTLQREHGNPEQFLRMIALLHVSGVRVDWNRVLGAAPVAPLPTYAFQRRRYWIDPPSHGSGSKSQPDDAFWKAVTDGAADRIADLLAAPERLRTSIEELLPLLSTWQDKQQAHSKVAPWLYDDVWQPAALPGPRTVALDGAWALAVADDQAGLAAELERELRLAGAVVHLVDAAQDRAALTRSLRALPAGLQGIVTLGGIDTAPDADGVPVGFRRTLALVQAIGDCELALPVWMLTRGAVSVDGAEPLPHPLQSLVNGLGRVVSLEQPALAGGVVDLPPQPHDGWALELVRTLRADDHEDQVALRPEGRFVRRMLRTAPQTPDTAWTTSGTALITGGTGALGLHLARWLADRGTTHLVLASRSAGTAPEAAALRDELAAKGVTVTLATCDIADRHQTEELLARCATPDAPLRVVAHLAGMSRGTALGAIAPEQIAGELAAKVRGGWNLHELLADQPLDAFLLYGSGASLWGGAHQALYAAANTGLDALARHRRTRGLTATVLHWGGWAGDGMLTADAEEHVQARGLHSMDPAHALTAVGLALGSNLTTLGVADIDWSRFAPAYSAARPRPLIQDIDDVRAALAAHTVPHDPLAGARLRDELSRMSPDNRQHTMTELVRTEMAHVLGLPPTGIPAGQPLQQLGFDSLMAVTVRGTLARATGLPLTTDVLVKYGTCHAIARRLLEDLLDTPSDEPEQHGTDANPWLRVLKPAERPHARIVCVPGMGGTTGGYVPLIRSLPEGVELLGVQLPGREARTDEPPMTDMMAVAEEITGALAESGDVPVVLYGHSQGSWLAWEVAHRLGERDTAPPLSLVVACARTPYADTPELIQRIGEATAAWDGTSTAQLAEVYQGLLPQQILDNEDLLAEYVRRLIVDVELGENHRSALADVQRDALKIPVLAVAGTEDPVVPQESMEAWRELTLGAFTRRDIEGTHAAPIENAEAMAAELVSAIPSRAV